MIVPVHPPIEGIAAERFRALANNLRDSRGRQRATQFAELCAREVEWVQNHPNLNGCREIYEAAVRVLVDLARLNWAIQEDRFGIELQAPSFLPKRGLQPDDIARSKDTIRGELSPICAAQFTEPATLDFVRRMEHPTPKSGRKPIPLLIADGRELRARLEPALSATGDERTTRLANGIRPYLQLVEEKADEHTGILLGEIWRYFRYTWSLPTINIPGRQLFYLVRDAGHPHHAVMGIAALSNCAMQMRERDNFLGWTCDAFVERVESALRSENSRAELANLFAILEHHIEEALGDISATGLATKQETENPTPEIVARLRRQSYEFADDRKEALEELAGEVDQPLTMQEAEAGPYGIPPIAEEVLVLEKKVHDQPKFRKARSLMVAKKRAFELARLLGARVRLREIKDQFLDPARILSVLHLDETRIAITTAWLAAKTRRVGTNLLELTTCGAIPPYNHLLGGKLTALLLLSPQVNADYRARYGSEPSIIGSLLVTVQAVADAAGKSEGAAWPCNEASHTFVR